VLGDNMYEAGAYCDQIPLTEPGVAYVISETTLKPVCVRAAWVDDAAIQQVLLEPVRALDASLGKEESLSGQLGWNGEPLQQRNDRV
jgi:hypothetical protein